MCAHTESAEKSACAPIRMCAHTCANVRPSTSAPIRVCESAPIRMCESAPIWDLHVRPSVG